MTTDIDVPMWSKRNPAWGSGRRIQRNCYAYRVAVALAGSEGICPTCLGELDLDTAEIDRPIPANDYRPGNVVTVCNACNQGRSVLQSVGRDWTHVNDYVSDVLAASAAIRIPAVSEARQWWARRPSARGERVSRYA